MINNDSKKLEETLSKPDFHLLWEKTYYSDRNNKFYDLAIDKIINIIKLDTNAKILDAGCGNAAHSIRFAERGYNVLGIDFSEEALKLSRNQILSKNLQTKIELKKDTILSLSFKDNIFDMVYCWGVLMHIDDNEKALSELSRVLKNDGYLILGEGNMNSIQSRIAKIWKKNHGDERMILNEDGLYFWSDSDAGEILVRKTNINWLNKFLEREGLSLYKRLPGQFTSLYIRVQNAFLRNVIYIFNEFWFKIVKNSSLAEANILIYKKENRVS
jgi:SAM-dependent methyltransferase